MNIKQRVALKVSILVQIIYIYKCTPVCMSVSAIDVVQNQR